MRFTLLSEASRWTLCFPNSLLVPRALGEFDGVIRSQFSFFPQYRFSPVSILRHTTQLFSLLRQLILSHNFSLTFCLAAHQPPRVGNKRWCDVLNHRCGHEFDHWIRLCVGDVRLVPRIRSLRLVHRRQHQVQEPQNRDQRTSRRSWGNGWYPPEWQHRPWSVEVSCQPSGATWSQP